MLILYVAAQLNQPKEFDWTPTLRNDDKNPFGASILFKEIRQLFPHSSLLSHREPAYNVLHEKDNENSAYFILAPQISLGKTDLDELLHFAEDGNEIFLSALDMSDNILDTLGLKEQQVFRVIENDSGSVNFVNPGLKAISGYKFRKGTSDGFFSQVRKGDSTVILGINNRQQPDFVKIQYGRGAFFVHALPLCFSNYFMLFGNNSEYAAKALSYIDPAITTLHWDEYYKAGREGPQTPLRFFLSNEFLTYALWLTVIVLILYILFEMKRKQRIIPVIEPLRNTTLDFAETVSSVYFSRHDNNSIAKKKIQYWTDFVRQRYYLSANMMDENFVQQLSRKSGVEKEKIEETILFIKKGNMQPKVTDETLLALNKSMEQFYQLAKI